MSENVIISGLHGEKVTLSACPIGLFLNAYGDLCLKTEYGNNEGRIDAYIVSSGEFFWGDNPQTIENQRKQLVTPVYDARTLKLAEKAAFDLGRFFGLLKAREIALKQCASYDNDDYQENALQGECYEIASKIKAEMTRP
jgi:hypothetical protein